MAEAQEVVATTQEITPAPEQQAELVQQEPQQTAPVVPPPQPDDDDREPGGDDPQAVRARKEYRARKRAEQLAAQEREQRIRLEERTRALEEAVKQRPEAAKPERVFTLAEVNKAVEQGAITREQADHYIQTEIFPHQAREILKAEREAQARQTPVEKALTYVNEYMEHMPTLYDRQSEDFRRVAQRYHQLIAQGAPDNAVTQQWAIEMVHGDLSTLKRKAEHNRLNAQPRTIPVEVNGGTRAPSNGKVDISKASEWQKHMWDRTGTPQDQREREMRIYMERHGGKTP